MIKTPVRPELGMADDVLIRDAKGGLICTTWITFADQIVSALNAQPTCKTCNDIGYVGPFKLGYAAELCPDCQKPKCETCGGSGKIPKGTFIETHRQGDLKGPGKPCPDCQPATQTGELVNRLEKELKTLMACTYELPDAKQLRELVSAIAARIEELEKALEKHKHTDECLRYAAKTSKASGVYHCIADCTYSLKAVLGEETKKCDKCGSPDIYKEWDNVKLCQICFEDLGADARALTEPDNEETNA